MNHSNVLLKIPSMNDNDLLDLYKNAVRLISNDKFPDAEEVVKGIGDEWGKRLAQAKEGRYKATTPDIGMLKSLGYSVGESGVRTQKRRIILDTVITENLPIIGSPAYTLEWGEKNSRKRYKKLHRTIQAFISGAVTQNRSNMEKAVIEWKEDLEYVENKFGEFE